MLPECAKQIILLNPDLGNTYDRKMSKLLAIICYKGEVVITIIPFLCQADGVLCLKPVNCLLSYEKLWDLKLVLWCWHNSSVLSKQCEYLT